ncbi:hypothetical protein [Carnobacterium maltaromaticum]|uniref:hypothetical protein n=1 Tax=Carnobacterium maltaromaticum TaxID=2751 RepID=UPI00295E3EE3|nr:hypothetical protein [Carnobacterium maltaromaticum]
MIGYLFFSILSNDLKKEVAKQEAGISRLKKKSKRGKRKNNEVLIELQNEKIIKKQKR